MSKYLKQHAVIYFLAKNVNHTDIHCRLKVFYGNENVDKTTVNRWKTTPFI